VTIENFSNKAAGNQTAEHHRQTVKTNLGIPWSGEDEIMDAVTIPDLRKDFFTFCQVHPFHMQYNNGMGIIIAFCNLQIADVDHKARSWCTKMCNKMFLETVRIRLHLVTGELNEGQPYYKLGIRMIKVCNEAL
jgi:hypothetical protein